MKFTSLTFWKKTFLGIALLFSLSGSSLVLAQSSITAPPSIIPTGTGGTLTIPHNNSAESQGSYLNNRLLPGIAATIIGLTGAVALVVVVIGGITLLTSYGDPAKAAVAKKTITYAIAGIIISGLSYAIVAIVASLNFG